ncbi:hypothetical protein [Streptomyces sp. NPDC003015]
MSVRALSAAGVPLVASGGPGGGCRLMEGWRSPLLGIRAEEATALPAVAPGAVRWNGSRWATRWPRRA